jgi:putative FmdB family regulatory protein
MPLYSFKCSSCGTVFEVLQKTAQSEKPSCPGCRSEDVARTPSLPARPVFKQNATTGGGGSSGGCENPKRCCEKQR